MLVVAMLFMTAAPQSDTVELIKVTGIDSDTQDQIDSGEWSEPMVRDMMKKGLLPPESFEKKEDRFGFNVQDDGRVRSYNDTKVAVGSSGGSSGGTFSQPGNSSGNSSGNSATGVNVTANRAAGTNETGASDADTASGRQVEKHTTPGHCQNDPHIICSSVEDCSAVGGACVWWYCSEDPEKSCMNTNDCSESGGICTGPGYCKEFRQAPCSRDDDCDPFGGVCVVGGHCLQDPDFACLDDDDCRAHDRCSYHEPVWWRANEDFPQDESLGPYQNWTDQQLRQKMIIAMKKMLHIQRDLETQVPINSKIASYYERIRANVSAWEGVSPGLVNGSRHEMAASFSLAIQRIHHRVDPLRAYVDAFAKTLQQVAAKQRSSTAEINRKFRLFQRSRGAEVQRLVALEMELLAELNDTTRAALSNRDPATFLELWGSKLNRSTDQYVTDYGQLINQYNGSAIERFSRGFNEIRDSLLPFKKQTRQYLLDADKDVNKTQAALAAQLAKSGAQLELLTNSTVAMMNLTILGLQDVAGANEVQLTNATGLV